MFRLLAVVLLVGLGACSKPADTVIPADMASWETALKPSVEKLEQEDRRLFAAYMARAKMGEALGGAGLPPGTTVGAAIQGQRDFEARKAQEEAEARALAEKAKKEREAAMVKMREAVTVAIAGKSIEVERGYSGMEIDRHLKLRVAYQNNTGTPVAGVKGRLVVNDLFGDELTVFAISNDDTIKPKETIYWVGNRSVKYRPNSSKDEKFAELADDKYTVTWEPEMVIFADGTKLVSPK